MLIVLQCRKEEEAECPQGTPQSLPGPRPGPQMALPREEQEGATEDPAGPAPGPCQPQGSGAPGTGLALPRDLASVCVPWGLPEMPLGDLGDGTYTARTRGRAHHVTPPVSHEGTSCSR